jgi:hypothetical protein
MLRDLEEFVLARVRWVGAVGAIVVGVCDQGELALLERVRRVYMKQQEVVS